MKPVAIFFVIALIAITPIFGQAIPEDASAVIVGPVIAESQLSLTVGYSKEMIGLHLVSIGKFGETVEAEGQVLKLFKVIERLYAGPIAGGGIDWSDEAGTGGELVASHVFGATGAAVTYSFGGHLGAWGFWKRHITEKANEPTAGIGLYYKF